MNQAICEMKFGTDVGYHSTKFVYGIGGKEIPDAFLSTYKRGHDSLNSDLNVEFEGNKYTVGLISGKPTENLNKLKDDKFKLFLLTSFAKAMPTNEANISFVTGLPVDFHESQKDQLKRMFEKQSFKLTLGTQEKTININQCIPFPQCAGLFVLYPEEFKNGKNVVIDMGGGTTDISCFNGYELINKKTITTGALDLYDKVIDKLASDPKYAVSFDKMEAAEIIDTGKAFINGKEEDLSKIVEEIKHNFADEIYTRIGDEVKEFNTSRRTFLGGGNIKLKSYLPAGRLIDDVHFNAKIFYRIALSKTK